MLTSLQRSIVNHEVARKLEGKETVMNVTEFCANLGVSRETYYRHCANKEVEQAIAELTEKASQSRDYAALIFRQAALEALMKMITDKNTRDIDRRAAIKDLMAETKYADVDFDEVPYAEWTDEDLLAEALGRKERLGLTEAEIREIAHRG